MVPYLETAWVVGLRPGASYQFRIAARNGRGMSTPSGISALTTANPNRAWGRSSCLSMRWWWTHAFA